MVARAENANTSIAMPKLGKRDPFCSQYDSQCSSDCLQMVYRSILQTVNEDVYGYYHYLSDTFCGTGSISQTYEATYSSGVTLGGYGQIPGVSSIIFSTLGKV